VKVARAEVSPEKMDKDLAQLRSAIRMSTSLRQRDTNAFFSHSQIVFKRTLLDGVTLKQVALQQKVIQAVYAALKLRSNVTFPSTLENASSAMSIVKNVQEQHNSNA
jgi:hypothetical protein